MQTNSLRCIDTLQAVILKLCSWSGGFKRVTYEALHHLRYLLMGNEAPTIWIGRPPEGFFLFFKLTHLKMQTAKC